MAFDVYDAQEMDLKVGQDLDDPDSTKFYREPTSPQNKAVRKYDGYKSTTEPDRDSSQNRCEHTVRLRRLRVHAELPQEEYGATEYANRQGM